MKYNMMKYDQEETLEKKPNPEKPDSLKRKIEQKNTERKQK